MTPSSAVDSLEPLELRVLLEGSALGHSLSTVLMFKGQPSPSLRRSAHSRSVPLPRRRVLHRQRRLPSSSWGSKVQQQQPVCRRVSFLRACPSWVQGRRAKDQERRDSQTDWERTCRGRVMSCSRCRRSVRSTGEGCQHHFTLTSDQRATREMWEEMKECFAPACQSLNGRGQGGRGSSGSGAVLELMCTR